MPYEDSCRVERELSLAFAAERDHEGDAVASQLLEDFLGAIAGIGQSLCGQLPEVVRKRGPDTSSRAMI